MNALVGEYQCACTVVIELNYSYWMSIEFSGNVSVICLSLCAPAVWIALCSSSANDLVEMFWFEFVAECSVAYFSLDLVFI